MPASRLGSSPARSRIDCPFATRLRHTQSAPHHRIYRRGTCRYRGNPCGLVLESCRSAIGRLCGKVFLRSSTRGKAENDSSQVLIGGRDTPEDKRSRIGLPSIRPQSDYLLQSVQGRHLHLRVNSVCYPRCSRSPSTGWSVADGGRARPS